MAVDWIDDILRAQNVGEKETTLEKAFIAARLGSSSAQAFLYNVFLAYNPYYVYNLDYFPKGTCNESVSTNPWTEFWALVESIRTESKTYPEHCRILVDLSKQFEKNTWDKLCIAVLKKDLKIPIESVRKTLKNTEWQIPDFDCAQFEIKNSSISNLQCKNVRLEPVISTRRIIAVLTKSTVRLYNCEGKYLKMYQSIVMDLKLIKHLWDSCEYITNRFVLDGVVTKRNSRTVYVINDIINLLEFQNLSNQTRLEHRLENLHHVRNDLKDFTENIELMPGVQCDGENTNLINNFIDNLKKSSKINNVLCRDLKSTYHNLDKKNEIFLLHDAQNFS